MSSSKKLTCSGTLQQVFIRVRQEIQSVMLVLRPSFVNCCPSPLLYVVQLPPSLCEKIYCVQYSV